MITQKTKNNILILKQYILILMIFFGWAYLNLFFYLNIGEMMFSSLVTLVILSILKNPHENTTQKE